MFAGKARSLPSREFRGYAPALTNNHLTKLEMPSRDKYSSLFGLFVNYCRKFFITLAPGRNRRNMRVNKFL